MELVIEAVKMYRGRETERKVSGEYFDGCISTKGESCSLGGLAGQIFEARIETARGTSRLAFIIREHSNPDWN